MEREKHDSSAFSVPGTMQDQTIMSTPLPQAASTANKRRTSTASVDSEFKSILEQSEKLDDLQIKMAESVTDWDRLEAELETNQGNVKRVSSLENACKNMSRIQEELAKVTQELAKSKAAQMRAKPSKIPVHSSGINQRDGAGSSRSSYAHEEEIMNRFSSDFQKNKSSQAESASGPKPGLKSETRHISKGSSLITEQGSSDFEFLVPSLPAKRTGLDRRQKSDLSNYKTVSNDFASDSKSNKDLDNSRKSNVSSFFKDLPEKLSRGSSKFEESAEFKDYEQDRVSISSSANSSLGIISQDAIEDVKDKPLTEFSFQEKLDLSQRLAKELNLDTSHIKDSHLDISELVSGRLKRALASQSGEDKENTGNESRTSSNYLTLHGYSTDNSGNNTAKRLSKLSLNSEGETELQREERSLSSKKRPLTEQNFESSRDSFSYKSTNRLSSQSGDWNPFGEESKFSIASDEFQSGENVYDKMNNDEEAWRGEFNQSLRSLSGIYGSCADLSLRSQGEKLSMSSFLRSGSGPLGCLDKGDEAQRPHFGQPITSPEKKFKSRPLQPPPEEKHTFVLDEEPTKDVGGGGREPWDPRSLRDQFSVVHEPQSSDAADVSVPSLSCIGDLLAEMGENADPRQMLDKMQAALREKSKKNNQRERRETKIITLDDTDASSSGLQQGKKTIPSVVAGRNSFCRGYESDRSTKYSSSFDSHLSIDEMLLPRKPTSRSVISIDDSIEPQRRPANHSVITINDSVAPSMCNVTDFEGAEEEECICVMTPESMDFDIFNDFDREQHYRLAKACYVNDYRQDNAAIIYLPVTFFYSLKPGEKRTVSVTVAALVGETIKIKVDVTRTDPVTLESEVNTVFGKVVAELPKISLLGPFPLNMKPLVGLDGKEYCGKYQEILELTNKGRSSVPIKLTLTENNTNNIFYFGEENNRSVVLRIGPGQTYKQKVYCQCPPVFNISKATGPPVTACIYVHLDTQTKLPPLSKVDLRVQFSPNFFCAPSSLQVGSDRPAPCKLYNSGSAPATIEARTTDGFVAQPSTFTIPPLRSVTVMVTYTGGSRSGALTLTTMDHRGMHNVILTGTGTDSTCNSCFVTPQSSRATSPTSPFNLTGPQGALKLTCTHKELVWGGCSLQQRAVKTCSIKNLSGHREKLRLSITDSHQFYKLLNEKKGLDREVKLSLQPMENRQISVVLLTGTTGPKLGHLTISRINSPADKKVLPLFGFGGKAKVSIEGILQDPEQHMWLYLDPNSLCSSFTLTNTGDYAAFVKISGGMSAPTVSGGLSIVPPECILPPGQSVAVEISLSVTPERLEYLLAHSTQTAICVTRVSVMHGDESTRLRLTRLSRSDAQLAAKLALLSQLTPAAPIPDIHKLDDPPKCAETLWVEDISEWSVGVLVKRSALEALRLDTSVQFVDLSNTVLH